MELTDPTTGSNVRYAGFWVRLAARLIDLIVLSPVIFLDYWLARQTVTLAVVAAGGYLVVAQAYEICLVALKGGSVGKLVLGLRIVCLDGRPAGWRESFLRRSVDLVLATLALVGRLPSLVLVSPQQYASLTSAAARNALRYSVAYPWYRPVEGLLVTWLLVDAGTLLFNDRRRAIHDFIAGTVVLRVGSVEQAHRADPASAIIQSAPERRSCATRSTED